MNMLLQAKNHKKNRNEHFLIKNRKGVSIMVGYVLLVVFAIILSVVVFQWIKTYIPSDPLQCPDSGVSISIKAVSYDCGNNTLYLLIKNNGRFNILGYFAHAANVSGQEVATIDLSQYFQANVSAGQKFGNSIAFISAEQNLFKPGDEKAAIFNLNNTIGTMTSIQITPTRMQEVDNKNRFISCGNEKVKQEVYCGMDTRIVDTLCVPNTCSGLGYECDTWGNGCSGTLDCGDCTGSDVCTMAGQCVPEADCLDTCGTYGYECGTHTICGGSVDCTVETGGCNLSTETCNDATGKCVLLCGNGVIEPPEEGCDDGNTNNGDGCSSVCTVEGGWACIGEPSVCEIISGDAPSCTNHCLSLGLGYIESVCPANPGQCTSQYGGDTQGTNPGETGYDECILTGAPAGSVCCCYPAT